jgi:hypothetical protein
MFSTRLCALVTAVFIGATVGANAQSASAPPSDNAAASAAHATAATPIVDSVLPTFTLPTFITVVNLLPEQGKLTDLLKKEAAKAIASGRTPFVQIGAPSCVHCLSFEEALHDSSLTGAFKDAFKGTYIIYLDTDRWTEQDDVQKLLYKVLGIDTSSVGMPAFFALNGTGAWTGKRIESSEFATLPDPAAPLKTFFRKNLRKS